MGSKELIIAVKAGNTAETSRLIEQGTNPDARDADSGLTALMIASGSGNTDLVSILLKADADLFTTDSKAGATALHKACQRGSLETVRMLVEAGAFVNAVAVTTGHTPLIEALWFKQPDVVQYLLDHGAGLEMKTHYGFTLLEHFNYAMNVNVYGKEKLELADGMLKARQQADQRQVEKQQLMKAVIDNDLKKVRRLLSDGAGPEERYPVLNGFNDAHTPLLVACRDGHTEIVAELLKSGADVNAVEPTFGAVPLHKAVYNGHAEITLLLVKQNSINLDSQGCTNGYTALHDALWHGFRECAEILIHAGARLDLKGHDGKMPVDIAADVFGEEDEMVGLIKEKMQHIDDLIKS